MRLFYFFTTSIGKKTVMALTGLSLGFFLLAHLMGNITSFFGRQAFNNYAEHLHSIGSLINFFEAGLLSIFLLHIIFATTLYFENLSARPERYKISKKAGGSTLGSKTMPFTGVIILAFVVLHLKTFHFADNNILVADLVRQNFQSPLMIFLYITGLSALIIHTSHGFWSIFQSLGLNHPKYNTFIHTGALVLSITGGIIFILIPLVTFVYNDFLL